MKTALYNNKLINLETIKREDYQKLYEDGKKGLLTCSACGKPIRFYLGIDTPPHFFHHLDKQSPCADPISQKVEIQENKEVLEQNGFRLPKSRSIAVQEPEPSYKASKLVKIQRSFARQSVMASEGRTEYLIKLKQAGIQFDVNQEKAVIHTKGPLLILAGAGSGKTRVLTARTAFMLVEEQTIPNEIMLVTFTAKAAAEIKKRMLTYPEIDIQKVNSIVSGTFHSIFYKILLFHQREKWSSEHLLKRDWQREQILKEAGRSMALDEKEFAYDLALQQIGFWKNTMKRPEQIKPEGEWEEKAVHLYRHYEETKAKNNLFDFDDMLLGCHRFFCDNPQLLEQYQNRFEHFLIDEFQDINKIQYELIKILSQRTKNICVVGDDDQSIVRP